MFFFKRKAKTGNVYNFGISSKKGKIFPLFAVFVTDIPGAFLPFCEIVFILSNLFANCNVLCLLFQKKSGIL